MAFGLAELLLQKTLKTNSVITRTNSEKPMDVRTIPANRVKISWTSGLSRWIMGPEKKLVTTTTMAKRKQTKEIGVFCISPKIVYSSRFGSLSRKAGELSSVSPQHQIQANPAIKQYSSDGVRLRTRMTTSINACRITVLQVWNVPFRGDMKNPQSHLSSN